MSSVKPPPNFEILAEQDGKPRIPWMLFFDSVHKGDAGTLWTPTFTGLTETGTAVKTGIYYKISHKLVYYRIVITPATDTSSVLGTTYCNNFPLTMISDGMNVSCSGYTASVSGSTYSDNRIYTATWTTIATPVVIVGIAEVR